MSKESNNQGRAYEFAWIKILEKELNSKTNLKVIHNSSYEVNKRAWDLMDSQTKSTYKTSAEAAVRTILELEPRLEENDGKELTLEFQKDDKGTKGDVRDIVIKKDTIEWEIGLSIKHNHEAVKHSRLSRKLDFGNEWFDMPCSQNYWNDVKPIFDFLSEEKRKGTLWRELENKEDDVYVPILTAFMDEIKRSYANEPDVPQKMVEYLIGVKDYHKVVSKDSHQVTLIHTFNMHGTLNKPSKVKISAITVPTVELPTRLVALDFKKDNKTTVEMYLDNGWELSFRIHNAEKVLAPTLKFDVQFMGMPPTIMTISIKCK